MLADRRYAAALALLLLAACADSESADDGAALMADAGPDEPGTRPVGAPCTDSAQCQYLACIKVAEGRSVCSVACDDDTECPQAANWACIFPPAIEVRVCACQADARSEICGDGLDNDCNGVVDCASRPPDGGADSPAPDAGADAGGCTTGDCGEPAGPASCATDPGVCPACAADADCDDGIGCTEDHCRARACVHLPKDNLCAGAEVCDPRMDGCTTGTACANDTDCEDEDACTQIERCDVALAVCRFSLLDGDGDEHFPMLCGGDDCDDTRANVYPGALDVCDGVDNDCNGSVDPASAALLCAADRSCSGGVCVCASGSLACGGRCMPEIMFESDPFNCGACGITCGPARECVDGACADIDECAGGGSCTASAVCGNTLGGSFCTRRAKAVSAGGWHSCAILADDTVKCWGNNDAGQLGLGDTILRGYARSDLGSDLPVVDLGTSTAQAISAGSNHTCAVLENDTVKCWGYNDSGQLGLGDTSYRGDEPGEMGNALPAVNLGDGRTAKAISAGGAHTCALLDDDTIKCWGRGDYGQLGYGNNYYRGASPGEMGNALPTVDLGSGHTAKAIAAGANHTCALLDDDSIKCWGANDSGQLGVGDAYYRGDNSGEMGDALPAVQLGTGRTARGVAVGESHTCALLDDGSVKCWGYGGYGALGLGDFESRGDSAAEMGNALPAVQLGTSLTAVAIRANTVFTCALLSNAQVKCWGYGESGRLGVGDTESRGDQSGEMGNALAPVDLGAP